MQAVRVERRRSPDARWLHHLSLLAALGLLFTSIAASRTPATAELAQRLPVQFLAPPSTPTQEWQPIRVPVRTQITPSPSQIAATDPSDSQALTVSTDASVAEAAVRANPVVGWVQAHRKTTLFAEPNADSPREAEVPQWSVMRLVESQPHWLKVTLGGDGGSRDTDTAWIPAEDIGALAEPPRFVTSTRPTTLWSADGTTAETVASVPRLATLALAGLADRNGRVAVRVGDADNTDGRIAWVNWSDVSVSRAPTERDVPNDRAFSPYASTVRLSVPYRTQLDGSLSSAANCGPTSVSMVLESFGVYVPTAQARTLAMRAMGVYDPWGGTTLESLQSVAQTYGLQGLDLHENGRYKRWTLDDVRTHLRAGHPVIPELRYRMMPGREWLWISTDHYVVITGMIGDDFVINDPIGMDGHGERVITGQALLRAWMSSDFPGAGFAIARPL
jgi:Peptidase_C39 like family